MHINNYELVVYAPRRSGHHAIITWLSYHFPEPVYLINDCRHFLNPYKHWATWDKPFDGWTRALKDGNYQQLPFNNKTIIPTIHQQPKQCLIYNYEDPVLTHHILPSTESSRRRFNIIILRDFYNNLASYLANRVTKKHPQQLVRSWSSLAGEVLGQTTYLGQHLYISYDQWFTSRSYRELIATSLDLECTDEGVNVVARFGGGSSFDKRQFNNKAQEMDVLNRHLEMESDPTYQAIINQNPQIIKLNAELKGDNG